MEDSPLEGFDSFVQRRLKDWGVPGCAVGVVKGRRVIHAKGYGLRDLARRLPVEEKTNFYIGSCTKAFTATAMGILVDDGVLEWDTPVRDYLQSFKMHDAVATERATPRDLLAHRTGLPNHFGADPSRDRAELLAMLPHLEPCMDFRSGFRYCNKGYIVVGLLIEHVTGKSWEQFSRERIFKPLGMTGSTFAACARDGNSGFAPGGSFAIGYVRGRRRLMPWRHGWAEDIDLASLLRSIGPDGAIISNVRDMCTWLRLQIGRGAIGGRRIIARSTLNEIHTPQVVTPGWFYNGRELLDASYAMGWFVQAYRGHRCLFHGGAGVGFNAWVAFVPRENLGVVVLTNCQTPGGSYRAPLRVRRIIALNVLDRLLGLDQVRWNAREKRAAREWEAESGKQRPRRQPMHRARPSLPPSKYIGEYSHPGYGGVSVFLENRELKMKHHGYPYEMMHYDLLPCGRDSFVLSAPPQSDVQNVSVSFRVAGGEVKALEIPFDPTVRKIVFRRIKREKRT
jgi:CubicO group peptidase (beta-lactamase class C family)